MQSQQPFEPFLPQPPNIKLDSEQSDSDCSGKFLKIQISHPIRPPHIPTQCGRAGGGTGWAGRPEMAGTCGLPPQTIPNKSCQGFAQHCSRTAAPLLILRSLQARSLATSSPKVHVLIPVPVYLPRHTLQLRGSITADTYLYKGSAQPPYTQQTARTPFGRPPGLQR